VQIQKLANVFLSGVRHVRTERRQIQFQPGAKTKDRSTEAHTGTAAARSKGTQLSRHHSPCPATVGVGMNTPQLSLPVSAPIPDAVKKKRVLLIDTSHAKRDLLR